MKELITSMGQIPEGMNWAHISRELRLSEEFIHQHIDLVDCLIPVGENTTHNPKYFTKSELVELLRNGSISLLETAGNSNTVSQNIDEYFNTWFKRLNTVQWECPV